MSGSDSKILWELEDTADDCLSKAHKLRDEVFNLNIA